MQQNKNEKTERLHTGQKLIQSDSLFKYGIDAVLLSDFASKEIRNKNSVLDLGCGNGIISILLAEISRAEKICGLEIQEDAAELAKRNVILNNLDEKVIIKQGDIKNIKKLFEPCSFENVVTNPPYMKETKGKTCSNEKLAIARSEIKCNLEDVIKAASFVLKSNGNFFMINRPERLGETFVLLQKYNLGPKNLRLICPDENTEPTMFLIHSKKDFFPELKVMKNLVISNEDKTYTEEVLNIYGKTSRGANLPYEDTTCK
ncbi:MAG: methyltransferase [Treponemataceae bacterium]|nr:methyltransferase [Spirochaetales bacterium]MDY6031353.1 methyltransferase [Treponemataceae bacterium]